MGNGGHEISRSLPSIARATDIGRVRLVRLEKGEQTPQLKTLKVIAQALGVDATELVIERELLLH